MELITPLWFLAMIIASVIIIKTLEHILSVFATLIDEITELKNCQLQEWNFRTDSNERVIEKCRQIRGD